MSELLVANVRNQVTMPMVTEPMVTDVPDWQFSASDASVAGLVTMLDPVVVWTKAMEPVGRRVHRRLELNVSDRPRSSEVVRATMGP